MYMKPAFMFMNIPGCILDNARLMNEKKNAPGVFP